ncbi:hypothetical protein C2845_PM09G09720 [Panicum miliaceum]|uniref:Uncharacterized protein n=1 Tax=Panicum miliaceum TaxID=4540 RepID=A0A3L6RXA2_PANMI|nr:hypothetical protein C2845_PM09G09720 [Panicum miliaceum]
MDSDSELMESDAGADVTEVGLQEGSKQLSLGSQGCNLDRSTITQSSPLPCNEGKKREPQGPDSRFPPAEDSAITKALKRAVQHPGHLVFYPFEGTTFNSCEEAKKFL